MQTEDERWMRRCLELAERARGMTSPNPIVGAVVVKDQTVVGEGFHPKAGEPHGEVFALASAAEQARGATLYVNLEPCNHQGRTPPCTGAILKAGIARVVVGMVDPNPRVDGSGIDRLRAAGVEVTVGVLAEACRDLNEAFAHAITVGRPFGIWKYAMTLDGKIAAHTGHSYWVSGEEARARVHHLRAGVDAVIVGGNTVRLDNPRLTVRLVAGRNPLRVVLSRRLDLPARAHLWDQTEAPTLVFTGPDHDPRFAHHLEAQGVTVEVVENLTPTAVMARLAARSCLSVLWECGGELAWPALQEGMIQKLQAFIAPALVGGPAPTPLAGEGFARMDRALRLQRTQVETVGTDWLVTGYF
jgi:diaminohydroxyphosphoribosylaminopyrimidine deaminase/5-amino-6-(5-phosphoribosylamino)uracil reductase